MILPYTLYSCSLNSEEEQQKLVNDINVVLNLFGINSKVATPGKFQIIFLGSSITNKNIRFRVENKHIKSPNEVQYLGITINLKHTFTKHVNKLCNTASNHLRDLTRITKCLF